MNQLRTGNSKFSQFVAHLKKPYVKGFLKASQVAKPCNNIMQNCIIIFKLKPYLLGKGTDQVIHIF